MMHRNRPNMTQLASRAAAAEKAFQRNRTPDKDYTPDQIAILDAFQRFEEQERRRRLYLGLQRYWREALRG